MNHEQALAKMESQPVGAVDPKLSVLWEKIRPLVGLLGTIFGKKIKPYIKAFIAAIDELVANDEEE